MTSVMKKSLEFLKDKEKKDDWNDPADINLFEVKSDVDELKSELSNIKKTMGCKLMVDNKDETPEADAQTPEGNEHPDKGAEEQQPEAGKEESTPEGEGSEAPAEGDSAAAEPEGKSIVDLKSRIDKIEKDLKAVKKENADLKAIVEKAQQKAKGAENSEQKGQGQEEPKMVGPLDMV
jgi:small-conductance mechanosensitive channel